MVNQKVFLYGSLLKPKNQASLYGELLNELFKARLNGWVLIEDKDRSFILPSEGKVVEGIIFQLNAEQLEKTDHWMKVPEAFRRERVTIRGSDGNFYNVWAYTRRKPA